MHEMMFRILTEEVAKGNKPSSTFRAASFALVAKEIMAQFGVECHPSYVDNRMRTLSTMLLIKCWKSKAKIDTFF